MVAKRAYRPCSPGDYTRITAPTKYEHDDIPAMADDVPHPGFANAQRYTPSRQLAAGLAFPKHEMKRHGAALAIPRLSHVPCLSFDFADFELVRFCSVHLSMFLFRVLHVQLA